MRKKAFTLIELLVVISIIALLMGIIIPSLNQVRKQAKGVKCMSQLKQWCVVFMSYTDDNRGLFQDQIYVKTDQYCSYYIEEEIKLCPMAKKGTDEGGRDPFAKCSTFEDPSDKCSYGTNAWLCSVASGNRPYEKLWKTPNIKRGSNVPMYGDIMFWSNTTPFHNDLPPDHPYQKVWGDLNEMRSVCGDRHKDGMQWAFVDFSVRKIYPKELWRLQWHRNWNENNEPDPKWPEWMSKFTD